MSSRFSDIIPPNKRSIRNVPLNISVEDEPKHVKKKTLAGDARELMKIVDKERGKFKSKIIWGVALSCVLVLALIFISKSATATVSIVVNKKPIAISMDLNLSNSGSSTDSIAYDLVKVVLTENIPVEAISIGTGTAALGVKATGLVTIYNNHSAEKQVLVKNTRLESPDGKIFFLSDKVTVPGQKVVNKVSTPGSVSAKIVAEKDGSSYNIGIKNFTFPGLKSTAKYKTIYAKAKTPIDGGAAPRSKVVVDNNVLTTIQASLLDRANMQVSAQKADDYVMIPGGTQETLRIDESNSAALNFSTLLIKKGDLVAQIHTSKNLETDFLLDNKDEILLDTSLLKLSLPDDLKLDTAPIGTQLKVGLSGTTTISNDLSDDVLKNELVGLSYDKAQKKLKNKIGVEALDLEIWPWWVKTIPSNRDRIEIKIETN